jgi:glycosyltransferase involved in cell wall biosynthesis
MQPARLSVIVATRDRARHLDAMLASYAGEWTDTLEFVVVDNGSRDDTAQVLERWKKERPNLRALHEPEPGQSVALNRGIAATTGPFVAFLDDDILVRPGWAAAYLRAFERSECAGFHGRILLEARAQADETKAALARRYKLLPITDHGTAACAVGELVGANMAVRREWLTQVGGFDERLGPGRTGFGGDSQVGRDIVSRGGKLLYVADACVEHVYDECRMTEAHFEDHHRRLGRSRFAARGSGSVSRVITNVVLSLVRSRCAKWGKAEEAYYRNRARYFEYSEMLRAWRESARGPRSHSGAG